MKVLGDQEGGMKGLEEDQEGEMTVLEVQEEGIVSVEVTTRGEVVSAEMIEINLVVEVMIGTVSEVVDRLIETNLVAEGTIETVLEAVDLIGTTSEVMTVIIVSVLVVMIGIMVEAMVVEAMIERSIVDQPDQGQDRSGTVSVAIEEEARVIPLAGDAIVGDRRRRKLAEVVLVDATVLGRMPVRMALKGAETGLGLEDLLEENKTAMGRVVVLGRHLRLLHHRKKAAGERIIRVVTKWKSKTCRQRPKTHRWKMRNRTRVLWWSTTTGRCLQRCLFTLSKATTSLTKVRCLCTSIVMVRTNSSN
uniref:Uncharacterized protein n=1 Tax=Cacopsylla melanoneura TaxID=428564 RepID=A0A8D8TWQ9_9HEMI